MTAAVKELPIRVQLSRRKGWRMPPNTIRVARPSKWGNPYHVGMWAEYSHTDAVRDYRAWLEQHGTHLSANNAFGKPPTIDEIRAQLRGKNLACWCGPGLSCHADVLLEIANS